MAATDLKEKLILYGKSLGTYKFVFLVMAVGLLLLFWPQEGASADAEVGSTGEEAFSVEALEKKLEESLSRIQGAGQVSVILTVETGMESVYVSDRAMSGDEREETLVVISEGNGKESAVTESWNYPTFRGALIVCEGGDNPTVKLQVTQAVAVLTGLGTDRISVCHGN